MAGAAHSRVYPTGDCRRVVLWLAAMPEGAGFLGVEGAALCRSGDPRSAAVLMKPERADL